MIIKSPAHSSVLSPVFVRCTAPSSPTLGLLLTGQLYNKKGWRGQLVHFSLPLLPTLLILPRPYPRVGNSGEEGELRKKKPDSIQLEQLESSTDATWVWQMASLPFLLCNLFMNY